ncbi:YcaO-like family protein [Acanthopleuribacter pedis]|uniref:YcaO-like family protein n=1 Tax=Acanthopleuribacter pedis TaxID=442870 RepID=A0A8J7U2W1_9BACT|nr:YcaO-like family protein [Acanthopleuribacter pedis]MBO1319728.1 YcaO-like family protein [Acanthopleuribacter pedis]
MSQTPTLSVPAHPYLIDINLRPLGDAATLVTTPAGTMFEIAAKPEEVGGWLRLCDGHHSLETILAAAGQDFAEVLEALLEDGCMAAEKPAGDLRPWLRFGGELDPTRLTKTRLHVLADDALLPHLANWQPYRRFVDHQLYNLSDLADMREQTNADDLVVVLLADLDSQRLLEIDAWARDNQITWASFHLEAGTGWLGPLVVPGQTGDYQDLHERRLCCADNKPMFEAVTGKSIHLPARRLPPRTELAWMIGAFFAELERFAVGATCRLLSTELQADPRSLELTPYHFLPMPHRVLEKPFLTSAPEGADALINNRSGVIVQSIEVKHHESVPDSLITYQAQVSNIAARYEAANDVIVGGSSFGNPEQSFYASIGETVERYCGNYIPGESLRRATYNELIAAGEHAIDPDSLVLFTKAMYAEEGCPMKPFTRDLPVLWVAGHSLTKDRPAWLPISLVYVNWYTALPEEPITNYMNFPGIAAGQNLEHALVSAIEELVERDTTMIWWMNRIAFPAMALTPECHAVWQGRPSNLGQRPWLIHLDNQFNIPVMAGVLENTREGFFNIGFACRPNAEEAGMKAWTEALTLQEGSRDMDDPNGLLRTSVEEWGLIEVPYKPWRKDRLYFDDYRADFRDVSDLLQQQQINLDPRGLERVREWVDTPRTRHFDELPSLPDRSLATYRERIESQGFEIFYKDITTNDVALTGLHAARVIIPGLVPNTPAAFPPLGGGRVQQAPVDMGLRQKPLSEAELHYAPLPHA